MARSKRLSDGLLLENRFELFAFLILSSALLKEESD